MGTADGAVDTETMSPEAASPAPLTSLEGLSMLVSTTAGAARIDLPSKSLLVLGRAPECEVVVDDSTVSRRHAVIHTGSGVHIEDLGSHNGTTVLGARLKPGERHPLFLGSVIELGSTTLVLHQARAAVASEEDRRPDDEVAPTVVDAQMQALYRTLDTAARGTLPVLILGETGTGKELFARQTHARSPRAAWPFLPINCAALPEALLESELFGYDKGAFTGAVKAKPGLLESADGGTVFLDEIAEMSAALQAKLLRVLESGEIRRLGSVRTRRLDVRLVSATNSPLESFVAEGRFRSDLYYRITGFTFELPPLRERPADVRALAERFARAAATKLGLAVPPITEEAFEALQAFGWPGNVRELRTVMERAVTIWHGDGTIEARHLMLRPAKPPAPRDEPPPSRQGDDERARIVGALADAAGNQKEAAKILGISLRTLVTRIEKYGILRPRKR